MLAREYAQFLAFSEIHLKDSKKSFGHPENDYKIKPVYKTTKICIQRKSCLTCK